mmetsp:Transcript_23911/g.61378  ORF Transcript_23911/g.61378 Transcript_23911/m.61378 type:complete len:246 (+) Transcript_23911:1702-2439(+)
MQRAKQRTGVAEWRPSTSARSPQPVRPYLLGSRISGGSARQLQSACAPCCCHMARRLMGSRPRRNALAVSIARPSCVLRATASTALGSTPSSCSPSRVSRRAAPSRKASSMPASLSRGSAGTPKYTEGKSSSLLDSTIAIWMACPGTSCPRAPEPQRPVRLYCAGTCISSASAFCPAISSKSGSSFRGTGRSAATSRPSARSSAHRRTTIVRTTSPTRPRATCCPASPPICGCTPGGRRGSPTPA